MTRGRFGEIPHCCCASDVCALPKGVRPAAHICAKRRHCTADGARSGVKDEHNNCILQPLPAGYSDMTGCWVEEYDAVGNRKIPVIMDGQYYQGMRWCDIIRTESAETLAVYGENFYAGKAAVTKNSYGKGCVYYIGTVGLPGFAQAGGRDAASTDIPYVENLPERVEVTVREGKGSASPFCLIMMKQQRNLISGEYR